MAAIDEWDPEQLLATAEADVVEYLVGQYSVVCPVLHRDRIEQLPVSEDVEKVEDLVGRRHERRNTKIVIIVPFVGEEDVFKYRASRSSFNPPRGQVRAGELRLTWTGEGLGQGDPAAVRRQLDEQLDKIEKQLGWSRVDIEQHNATVREAMTSGVAQRRAKLLADRHLEAGLGFPVRKRTDAAKYSVPAVRRRIASVPRPAASGPFRPEPTLEEAQYMNKHCRPCEMHATRWNAVPR